MKTAFGGEAIRNGERYLATPETGYGYADKNWCFHVFPITSYFQSPKGESSEV